MQTAYIITAQATNAHGKVASNLDSTEKLLFVHLRVAYLPIATLFYIKRARHPLSEEIIN